MTEAMHPTQFPGLWKKVLGLPKLSDLDAQTVVLWAQQMGLDVVDAVERDVGLFQTTRAIVLRVEGGAACFPKISHIDDPKWLDTKVKAERLASLWEKMEWFSPLWVPRGKYQALLKETEHCSRDQAVELFGYHFSTVYTLAFQAVCIAQLLPCSRSLAEYAPLAREAYLAFYSGYRASSIAALIPVVEGAMKRISIDSSDLPLPEQIDRVFDRACALAARLHFDGMWVPREYLSIDYLFGQDERVFAFETFKRWMKGSFFQNTDKYDGATWLNRHLFAHGTSSDWQQSANFERLVVALATLGVIESWHDESNQVSLFFPEMTQDSTLLWQQALFRGQMQMALNLNEQEHFQKHGRLVPELPTDGGITLRSAVLSEDCIRDLVRPLREAGWSVEVGEPDERALYMTVVATSGTERLTVMLLYSCGTGNELYRELEKSANVILYRGAPYHQDQYAYGISVHVGPVTGWQPPLAPSRK
ncbi:hypothetical protein [Rhodoferax saidenbachensis]|uniref:Uncharacterized protein n=1 Tax=Rhodoferax saidenbachensis TaxID=1484693 RepID=A0A1P8KAA7_9BURK|nr:hypothetical protein [Rhodoferax saidenbachensis]APW42923.1 hypothetical protein RS694_10515 [Rhodoferax saidenbachensis]